MCDYSLHAQASRAAEQAEILVTTTFAGTQTRGMASPEKLEEAVCMLPGTEVAFEQNARREASGFVRSALFSKDNIGDKFAKFVKINQDNMHSHHDALEFVNGEVVLLSDLVPGQKMTVVQLPAKPIPEKEIEQRAHSEQVIVPTDDDDEMLINEFG